MTDFSHLRRVAEAARKEREQNGGYIIESPADREFREAIDDPALVSLLLDGNEALGRVPIVQQRALEVMRKHGFVFETPLTKPDDERTDAERWEKLAFTLYTDLCELESYAMPALAALAAATPESASHLVPKAHEEGAGG